MPAPERQANTAMLLALNYSTQAAQLLAQRAIQIDRFKTPDWPDLVAEARIYSPVAVHFNLKAGRKRMHKADWARVDDLLETTGTYFINIHLIPETTDYPGIAVDLSSGKSFEKIVKEMVGDVTEVVRRYGAERTIVENVPYRGGLGEVLRPAVEPEVIRRITDETGCGLLLDISHARIAAHYLEIDEKEYMDALPTNRLRELHFTGLHNLDGYLKDHLPVLESDWPILDWTLKRIQTQRWAQPWMLAFEYGGVGEKFLGRSEASVIAEQVPILHRMIHTI